MDNDRVITIPPGGSAPLSPTKLRALSFRNGCPGPLLVAVKRDGSQVRLAEGHGKVRSDEIGLVAYSGQRGHINVVRGVCWISSPRPRRGKNSKRRHAA